MIRVLVADDEPDIRLLLRLQLDLLPDVEVVGTAADGDEAVLECRRLRPDTVVLDVLMPGINGLDAIEALRREIPGVGIVAFTGVAGDSLRDAMGIEGVPLVVKGSDVTVLADAIRSVSVRS